MFHTAPSISIRQIVCRRKATPFRSAQTWEVAWKTLLESHRTVSRCETTSRDGPRTRVKSRYQVFASTSSSSTRFLFKKNYLFLASLLVSASFARPIHAAPPPYSALGDIDDTMPTRSGIAAAASSAHAVRCRTLNCRAVEAIDELMKIVSYEDDNEEMGSAKILYSELAVWRWRRRALLDRPNLYPAFCTTGAKLLGRVSPGSDEIDVSVTLLVAAVDVDLRSRMSCVRDMVAALPRSPAADDVRIAAHNACTYDWHPRPRAACDTLVDGLPTAELR